MQLDSEIYSRDVISHGRLQHHAWPDQGGERICAWWPQDAIIESSYRYWIEIRVAAGTVKAAQLDMPLFLPHMNKHVGVKIM